MASLAHLFASRDRVFYELFAQLAATAVKAAEELVALLEHFPERHPGTDGDRCGRSSTTATSSCTSSAIGSTRRS